MKKYHTLTGNIKFHKNYFARKLRNRRTIAVYLPPSYDLNHKKRYPVLYMHDGQNIFDTATAFGGIEWQMDETAGKLISENKIEEIIIVGIYNNSNRRKEYTPYWDREEGGGEGDKYADFIIRGLKPFIDRHYRTLLGRNHTALMGSSLGGLISFYMAWKHPGIFSMAGVLSPALYWSDYKIIDEIIKAQRGKKIKIYLDMGTKEGSSTLKKFKSSIPDVRKMRDALLKKGYILNKNLKYFEDKGAVHNESAWAKRVHKALLFFFGKKWKRAQKIR